MTKIYKEIINHSIENSNVPTEDHLIEEMAELTKEFFNYKRNRESDVLGEMADVLFQIDKYIGLLGKTTEDLREMSIKKSYKKYPEFMESLK